MAKYSRSDGWHQIKVTAQSAQVSADLTNFVVYFDLSLLPADFWDNIEDGGGSIRVLKGDLDTEIAREIVSCDKTAETGEVHARADGTLSAASDTDFWFAFGKSGETDYAVDATYGQYEIWKDAEGSGNDFAFVGHDGGGSDSTGNISPSAEGGVTAGGVAGRIGYATEFDGNDDYFNLGGLDFTLFTWQIIFKSYDTSFSDERVLISNLDPANSGSKAPYSLNIDTDGKIDFTIHKSGSPLAGYDFSGDVGYNHYAVVNNPPGDETYMYLNGAVDVSGDVGVASEYDRTQIGIGHTAYSPWHGILDEVRIINAALSGGWLETEYNNQSDPATFWTIGAYEGPVVAAAGMVSPILLSPVKLSPVKIAGE